MIIFRVIDEVNCIIEGLPSPQLSNLQREFSFMEKGAHMTAAYRLGEWDGRVSLIDDEGITYNHLIEPICEFLESKYRLLSKNRIDLVDERTYDRVLPDDLPPVPIDYVKEETGYDFRPHQLESINAALRERKGIFNLATNAGKTVITVALSKVLDPYTKTVTVIPSEMLCRQTFEDYQKTDLNAGLFHSGIKKNKRADFIKNHRHIIVTDRLFCNEIALFADEHFAVMVDEVHRFGEVLEETLRVEVPHWQIRFGLTGSLPKDKLKMARIECTLGGGELSKLTANELVENGMAAKPYITMVKTHHEDILDIEDGLGDNYEWDVEKNYMTKNMDRIAAIKKYIDALPPMNTLVLCEAEYGEKMTEMYGIDFIFRETSVDDRIEKFNKFDTSEGHTQWASYGTSSTGVSTNQIFRMIFIDIQKDETRIKQSIGRGIRLDGIHNRVEIIDISANARFSNRHFNTRKKIYEEENHEFSVSDYKIEV